jgi:hypothetical protein
MENWQHGRLGLPYACGSDQKEVLAFQDMRDGLALRASWLVNVLFLQDLTDAFIQ